MNGAIRLIAAIAVDDFPDADGAEMAGCYQPVGEPECRG